MHFSSLAKIKCSFDLSNYTFALKTLNDSTVRRIEKLLYLKIKNNRNCWYDYWKYFS